MSPGGREEALGIAELATSLTEWTRPRPGNRPWVRVPGARSLERGTPFQRPLEGTEVPFQSQRAFDLLCPPNQNSSLAGPRGRFPGRGRVHAVEEVAN